MIKTICDSCGVEFVGGNERISEEFKGRLYFSNNKDTVCPFRLKVEITCFEFNMTNIHFCGKCLRDAIIDAVKR